MQGREMSTQVRSRNPSPNMSRGMDEFPQPTMRTRSVRRKNGVNSCLTAPQGRRGQHPAHGAAGTASVLRGNGARRALSPYVQYQSKKWSGPFCRSLVYLAFQYSTSPKSAVAGFSSTDMASSPAPFRAASRSSALLAAGKRNKSLRWTLPPAAGETQPPGENGRPPLLELGRRRGPMMPEPGDRVVVRDLHEGVRAASRAAGEARGG